MSDPVFDAESIAAFLQANPDFFIAHPATLEQIKLPDQSSNTIVLSFKQVDLLRQKNTQLQRELASAVAIAKANDRLFRAIHSLTLFLLESNQLDQALEGIKAKLTEQFEVDVVNLVLEERFGKSFSEQLPSLQLLDHTSAKTLRSLSSTEGTVCGKLSASYKNLLFPDNKEIQSSAIIPLGSLGYLGYLALGSLKDSHFHRDMDTLFLDSLGELFTKILRQMLVLPEHEHEFVN